MLAKRYGAIAIVRIGDQRTIGKVKATEYRYLLPLTNNEAQGEEEPDEGFIS